MTLSESRATHSWQDAVDLGPQLVSLAEALPSHESTGLVMQLQNLMVELPAMIMHDLMRGTELRFAPAFRLVAALELIEGVYPALDGAPVRSELDSLCARLASSSFNDQPAPAPVAAPAQEEADAPAPAYQPEPEAVAVTPEPEVQAVHVQPDISQ